MMFDSNSTCFVKNMNDGTNIIGIQLAGLHAPVQLGSKEFWLNKDISTVTLLKQVDKDQPQVTHRLISDNTWLSVHAMH